MLTFNDVQAELTKLWTVGGSVTLALRGLQCAIVHDRTAKEVAFDVHRADLELPLDKFGATVLAPQIKALQAIVRPD